MNVKIEFSEEYLENMLDAPPKYVEPEILRFFVWIMSEIERKDLSKEEIEYYISEDIIYNLKCAQGYAMTDDVEITQKDIKNWVEKCKKELLEDNLNLLDERYYVS